MLLAVGRFQATEFVDAVRRMSIGHSATTVARQHNDGWGAAAVLRGGAAVLVSRSAAAISACRHTDAFSRVECDALVVHARSASRESQRGLEYTHPIETRIGGERTWFFHNGYCPGLHAMLGCDPSTWDSAILLDWLIPAFAAPDWRAALQDRLSALPEGTTAANCIFLSARRAVVCNWFAPGPGAAEYYTMQANVAQTFAVIASEPFELTAGQWTPLGHGQIVEWTLDGQRPAVHAPSCRASRALPI